MDERNHIVKPARRRMQSVCVGPQTSWRFARQLARRRQFKSAAQGFLSSQFGNRFSRILGKSFSGELNYKRPDRLVRKDSPISIAQFLMSFNLNTIVHRLSSLSKSSVVPVWLSPDVPVLLVKIAGNSLIARLQAGANIFPNAKELRRSATIQSRFTLSTPVREASNWLRSFSSVLTHKSLFHPTLQRFVQAAPAERELKLQSEIHQTLERFVFSHRSPPETAHSEAATRPTSVDLSTILNSHSVSIALAKTVSTSPQFTTHFTSLNLARPVEGKHARSMSRQLSNQFWLTGNQQFIHGSSAIHNRSVINTLFPTMNPWSSALDFATFVSLPKIMQSQSRHVTPLMISSLSQTVPAAGPGTLPALTQVAWTTTLIQTRFPANFSHHLTHQSAGQDQPFRPAAEFTVVRAPVSAANAPQAFVFAQPARREVSEERVGKRPDTREIIEKVQLQVKKSLAAHSPLQNFTHQDFEQIGEHVYTALLRRLRVERERLGLN